jgi:hypothetical protein
MAQRRDLAGEVYFSRWLVEASSEGYSPDSDLVHSFRLNIIEPL